MITYNDTVFIAKLKDFLAEKRKSIHDNLGQITDYPQLRYQVGYEQCIKDVEAIADELMRKLKGL